MQVSIRSALVLSVGLLSLSACGKSDQFQVAPVSGTVKCNGTLITEGLVVFIPAGKPEGKSKDTGRSASGVIQPDGTYQLTTYTTADGAIVGSHTVQVLAPAPIDDDAPLTDANRYACGNAPLQKTVAEGKNVIDLELTFTPPGGGRRR
jgi:hypothetical protein